MLVDRVLAMPLWGGWQRLAESARVGRSLRRRNYDTMLMDTKRRPIFKITYQRPWGECVVNTAQFWSEEELRLGFAKSYPGCELLLVENVTKRFFS
jgi:hypothetical protein